MPHAIIPNVEEKYGDWRDQLFQDGYAIVKGAVPADRAAGYVEQMTQWLEKFPLGFDRNDPATWTEEHLPAHMKYGPISQSLYQANSSPEEECTTATPSHTRNSSGTPASNPAS
jgi:hypothetical protein